MLHAGASEERNGNTQLECGPPETAAGCLINVVKRRSVVMRREERRGKGGLKAKFMMMTTRR